MAIYERHFTLASAAAGGVVAQILRDALAAVESLPTDESRADG